MSNGQDILGQDEIDALMRGLDGTPPPAAAEQDTGGAKSYDFGRSTRIVRGRMPTLEMINERFARLLRVSFYNLLRRPAVVSASSVKIEKFGQYVQTLHLPTSLNIVKLHPLRGNALVILDPKLVFSMVDMYFGGRGRHAKIEGREFTPVETEIIRSLLKGAFENLREAWSQVAQLTIEHVGSEMNPHFANIVSPTEIVVVCSFAAEIEGRGGNLHVTLPYSMIEPLREQLDSGVQSDRVENDDRWAVALRQELEDAEVEVRALLGHSTITVNELLNLKPGDVLTSDFKGSLTLIAEGVPMFRGQYGESGGQHAVKVSERLKQRRPNSQRPTETP
jgi:flagellar motor switch protein FliM